MGQHSEGVGETYVRMRVSKDLRGPARPIELLVDTGSSYSVLPRKLLRELDIEALGKEPFELANGRVIWRDVGIAFLHFRRKPASTYVVFGTRRDSPVLGAVVLEELGYQVDPVNRRLRKARRRLLPARHPVARPA
ncbi:MAG: Retroviral aspartyl protease [Euryarchaeota archaeon]|nr:Retroviral aspartyl protease [Euryarchaeota archaeon]